MKKKLNQIVYQDPLTGNWISDPIDQDVKVVYKPGDIELDCLIAGNSEAVNKVHYTFGRYQIFQQKSLFEIFNDFVDQSNDADLVRLPTYKILPMVYGSKLAAGNGGKVNIRSSYGYIEFLKHHFKRGHGLQYADGASDYKIFPNDRNKTDIITKFYKQIGHFVALASIISITDIHSENLIVSNYQPHVIDLELSLTRVMDNIDKTGLFGNYGAVTAEKSVTTEIKLQDNSLLYLKREGDQKFYAQNRLWTVEPHAVVSYKNQKLERQHVPLEAIHIGIVKAFGLLHKNNNYTDNKFTAWFNRLTKDSGVIVRYMPYPTSRFETTVASVYRLSQFLDDAQYYKQVIKEDLAEVWKQDRRNEIPNPNYLVFQAAYMENDLLNCDIPVYYHRIGSLDILDSEFHFETTVASVYRLSQFLDDAQYYKQVIKEDLAEVWKQDRRNEIPNPNYLVFQAAYMENDLLNCDIPVYYHRIGSLDILDSSGQVVVVTTTIKIRQRKEDRTGFEEVDKNTNLGRGTFFAQSPMAQIVRQNQFSNVFNDNGRFNTRMNLVLNQVSRQLRMQALNQQSINALIT